MSKSNKAAKSIAVIIFFSFGSKILGFIRERLIALKFGSGVETDTFFIALSAIGLFTSMIIKSINTTMIPVLSEVEEKEGKQGKIDHTNNLLNIIILISFGLMVLGWILSPIIIKILGSGFEGKQFDLAVLMMKIGLPSILFASVQGVFRGYLQSELMFNESAMADLPFNFVYIGFLIFLSNTFGIIGLMVTSVLAVASQIIIQIPGLRKNSYRYKFILDFKDVYVQKIIYLVPPVLISATISDFNNIVDKSMASNLVEGSISSLQYANRLNGLVKGTFISAITTVLYPMLSNDANQKGYEGLKKTTIYGMNVIMLITIPATVGMIVLAYPIVKIAFEGGVFDSRATYMTAGALTFYSIGMMASSMKSVINKVYYSLQDTKTPMINSFITLCVNVVLNLILIQLMAHRGLALATSISSIITLLYLLYRLRKKIGPFGFIKSIKCGLKSLLAALIMGVVVYFLDAGLVNYLGSGKMRELLSLLISAGIGALIYFILIYIMRIEEVDWAINLVKIKVKRIFKKDK
ncbi:MAG TPA: murein biosynthesis integral membrane protein MurJ [Tissierellaceae bacterium]|nr:murein biosynthesis integral membrane protein MurJ [Tissierellaceae bacterium]